MPRFAANLTMLFTEESFLDRFEAASDAGFKGVEYLFPYDYTVDELNARLCDNNLQQILFNMPPGDWARGERGLAALPGRELEFEQGLEQSIHYAKALGCKQLHMMAGIPAQEISRQLAKSTYIHNLQVAAKACHAHGITVLIEPINRRDMPGYFLNHQLQAIELMNEVGAVNTALQMDLYHCQVTEGDLASRIHDHFSRVGHFQIAGVPDRHEPDAGEVNFPYLFDVIDRLGYQGWVGCEYHPRETTQEGLGWASSYGIA